MGRVRTKTIKKASRVLIEKYYNMLSADFQTNKKFIEEVAIIGSKRLRNKIGGFVTHLMKRIQRGSVVRGISLKLQELEKEKRFDFVPEVSFIDANINKGIHVDDDIQSMLDSIGFGKIKQLQKSHHTSTGPQKGQKKNRGNKKDTKKEGVETKTEEQK